MNQDEALLGKLGAILRLKALDASFLGADPGAELFDARRQFIKTAVVADKVQVFVGPRALSCGRPLVPGAWI
jgi:hypothetical protein